MDIRKHKYMREFFKNVSIMLILLTIVIYGHVTIIYADNNMTGPITYVAYMEEKLGFYRVIDDTTHKDPSYKERVLTINQGDTVIWLNDADVATLTVVSEQDLWDKSSSKLRPPNRRFNYTFMMSGTYTVYIDEYKNLVHQTIIVKPVEGYSTPTPNPTPKHTTSPTPKPTVSPKQSPVYTKTVVTTPVSTRTADQTSIAHSILDTNNSTNTKKIDPDFSWSTIIGFINAMSNLILSLSVMIIAYKVWKDY
jgi:plastocyanin